MENAFGFAADGSLDAPYDPSVIVSEPDERYVWIPRWERWQRYAAERGRVMLSCRHIIEFMTELGVFERREHEGVVRWFIPAVLPLVEDVLELTAEQRAFESERRWHEQFSHAHSAIIRWLCLQRTVDPFLRVETSIASLAATLDLDLEDTRHGLGLIANSAADIGLGRDPERAQLDDTFTITVDWRCLENERLILPEFLNGI
jgi:hypothetical protein